MICEVKKSKVPVNLKPHCHTQKISPRLTHTQRRRKITVSITHNYSNAHTHKDKYQREVKQTKVNTL